MKIILIILVVLSFLSSCNNKEPTKEIELSETSKINNQSKEIYENAILLIKDSGFIVDLDSVETKYQKLRNENPELALGFAKDLKEYAFDLEFKKMEKEPKHYKVQQAYPEYQNPPKFVLTEMNGRELEEKVCLQLNMIKLSNWN